MTISDSLVESKRTAVTDPRLSQDVTKCFLSDVATNLKYHQANIEQTSSTCILNTFARRLLDVCSITQTSHLCAIILL